MITRRNPDWTADEDALIAKLWDTHTALEIAALLPGRTRNAVLGRRHRLEKEKANPRKERPKHRRYKDVERIRAMAQDYIFGGLTREQVAKKHGVSLSRIGDIFKTEGIKLPEYERSRRFAEQLAKSPRPGRPEYWPDCPPHLRAEYDKLHYKMGFRRAEAKAMILGEAA